MHRRRPLRRAQALHRSPDHARTRPDQQQPQPQRRGVLVARVAVLVVFIRPLVAVAVGNEDDAIRDQVRQRMQPIGHEALGVRPQPRRNLPRREHAIDARTHQGGAFGALLARGRGRCCRGCGRHGKSVQLKHAKQSRALCHAPTRRLSQISSPQSQHVATNLHQKGADRGARIGLFRCSTLAASAILNNAANTLPHVTRSEIRRHAASHPTRHCR